MGIGVFEEADADLFEDAGGQAADGRGFGGGADGKFSEDAFHGVSADDVAHFVGKDEGEFVFVPITEMCESTIHEDKAAGYGKGIGFVSGEGLKGEMAAFVGEAVGEFGADFIKTLEAIRIGWDFRLLTDLAGDVLSDLEFGFEDFGLGAGERAEYPFSFADGGSDHFTQIVEETSHGCFFSMQTVKTLAKLRVAMPPVTRRTYYTR